MRSRRRGSLLAEQAVKILSSLRTEEFDEAPPQSDVQGSLINGHGGVGVR